MSDGDPTHCSCVKATSVPSTEDGHSQGCLLTETGKEQFVQQKEKRKERERKKSLEYRVKQFSLKGPGLLAQLTKLVLHKSIKEHSSIEEPKHSELSGSPPRPVS